MDHALAEALLRKAVELIYGGKILREARLLEFWIRVAQIVAFESGIRPHPARQKPAAQRAIAEGRDFVLTAIGQDIGLDATLEKIIG